MMVRVSEGNGRIGWSNMASLGMLVFVVIGALWTLVFGPVLDRFARIEKTVTELREEAKEELKLLRVNIASMREEMARTHFTRAEFDAWQVERNRTLESLLRRMEQVERDRK